MVETLDTSEFLNPIRRDDPNKPRHVDAMPCISTLHLSSIEREKVEPERWPVSCFSQPGIGFVVYIGDFDDELATDDEGDIVWPGLLIVAAWAQRLGYDYVRFDVDAHTVSNLPTFE